MSITEFQSNGSTYKIAVTLAPQDGKKYPVILFVHGNAGLVGSIGSQIRSFASQLAAKGYNAAIPQYYLDDEPHLTDTVPKDEILADAIDAVTALPSVDSERIGLVGFSLGSATSMTFIAKNPQETVSAFANFYGFLTPTIRAATDKFPPTIIFHNKMDGIVDVKNSRKLDALLSATIDHELIEYNDNNPLAKHHPFVPGGQADVESRDKTMSWFETHLPPDGS